MALLRDGSGGNLAESSISINFIQLAGGGAGVRTNIIEQIEQVQNHRCLHL